MTQWGLDTLFNPAKRHMDDEKRRLQATREEAGDSSGGKRIDLASGKVVIRRDEKDDADAAAADTGTKDTGSTDAGSTGAGSTDAGSTGGEEPGGRTSRGAAARNRNGRPAKSEPSAAAIRAAQRRGRVPK